MVSVLNLYYGLAADFEDLRAKKSALDVAQKFYEDNQKQVQIGTLAPLDVTTAESQLAASQLDLVNSQAALDQQEISLKNALSRTGVNDRRSQTSPSFRLIILSCRKMTIASIAGPGCYGASDPAGSGGRERKCRDLDIVGFGYQERNFTLA